LRVAASAKGRGRGPGAGHSGTATDNDGHRLWTRLSPGWRAQSPL